MDSEREGRDIREEKQIKQERRKTERQRIEK